MLHVAGEKNEAVFFKPIQKSRPPQSSLLVKEEEMLKQDGMRNLRVTLDSRLFFGKH